MKRRTKIFLSMLVILLLAVFAVAGYGLKIYLDVKGTAKEIYETPTRKKSAKREQVVDLESGEPISVLLLGVDTGDLGRTETGRSDTMLVTTINPEKKQTTIVSLERDIYTEIVGKGTKDKLNHAYAFGGVNMAIASVENLVDIPIDHYVVMNMKGFKQLVDAVNGVDVENTLDFTYEGTTFNKGTVHLDGSDALRYTRMRYDDPNGDYGRQERQRQVIAAIVKKAVNVSTVTNYKNILAAIEANTKTDLSWDNFLNLESKYRSALANMTSDHIQAVPASHNNDGISYQDVPKEELTRVQNLLKTQLNIQ